MSRLTSAALEQPQLLSIGAALCYWCALPPVGLPVFAWVVPVLWTALIRLPAPCGRLKFYAIVWLAGTLFWLAALNWLGLSVWWMQALWVVASFMLAAFWPAFIGVSRAAVHGLGCPVVIAAPVVWCGLEWVRKSWFFGGFSAVACLEHTQYENLTLIQSADLFGEYGVGLFMVFVGTCVGRLLPAAEAPGAARPALARRLDSKVFAVAACLCLVGLAVSYGRARLADVSNCPVAGEAPKVAIALLQGNIEATPLSSQQLSEDRLAQYRQLSRQAGSQADLVVWPEVTLDLACVDFCGDFVPEGWQDQPRQAVDEMLRKTRDESRRPLLDLAAEAGTSLLLNLAVTSYEQVGGETSVRYYNSALLVDPQGNVGPRHDKIRLVPVFERAPSLRRLLGECHSCPVFSPGDRLVAFPVRSRDGAAGREVRVAVNICFEAFFPDFVRNQVRTLAAEGKNPDVLVNMSNDASFELPGVAEMNLAIHVFRAVENRRPYLTATHAGYAAWIEPSGRIVQRGGHGAATYIVAEVGRGRTESIYTNSGDWLPVGCLWLTAILGLRWLLWARLQRGSHGIVVGPDGLGGR